MADRALRDFMELDELVLLSFDANQRRGKKDR